MAKKAQPKAPKRATLADLLTMEAALAVKEEQLRLLLRRTRRRGLGAVLALYVETLDRTLGELESRVTVVRWFHRILRDELAKSGK